MTTSGEAVGTIRDTGLADAPFDFDGLFRAQYGRVTSVVSRVVRDPGRAEELAVDAFLKLWRTPGAHGPGASAWVLRTALRLGIDELRRATRRARYAPLLRLVGNAPTPEDSAAAGEQRRRVQGVRQTPWPDMTIPTSTTGWTTGWQPWVRLRRARRRPSGHWRN